jgi:hypothetical protein
MTPCDENSTVFLSVDDGDSTYYANSTATAEQLELEGLKEEDDSHTSQDNRTLVFGTIDYGDGVIYTGYMSDNLPHGYGNLVYPDDISYLGYWSNGLEHGCGTMRWSNGDFHGTFEHGQPIGHGYRHGDGARCKLVGPPNLHEIAE